MHPLFMTGDASMANGSDGSRQAAAPHPGTDAAAGQRHPPNAFGQFGQFLQFWLPGSGGAGPAAGGAPSGSQHARSPITPSDQVWLFRPCYMLVLESDAPEAPAFVLTTTAQFCTGQLATALRNRSRCSWYTRPHVVSLHQNGSCCARSGGSCPTLRTMRSRRNDRWHQVWAA